MLREITQISDHSSLATLTYPTLNPVIKAIIQPDESLPTTLVPLDDSLSSPPSPPLLNSETPTSNPITVSRYPLSSSSCEKSFDPFGTTYFSDLIPTVAATTIKYGGTTTSNVHISTIPSKDQQQSLLMKSSADFSSSTPKTACHFCGDILYDIDDEEDDICRHFLHNLIDLDLLDDYATDSVAINSDCEPCADGNQLSNLGGAIMIHPDTFHLPFLLNSPTTTYPTHLSSSSSSLSSLSSLSTTSSSPTMMANIWANTYYRYQDPFGDDEFDPTQPLPATSPSLSSSSTRSLTLSPPYSYQTTTPEPTGGTAIDMLMTLLPHYTEQQVVSTLTSANYDMDHFLALLSSDGRSSVSYTKKRQICRHFLLGDCIRQDCRFAHDISIKVCRFWLQDKCLKGNQCEFAHSMESICIQGQDDFIDHTSIRQFKSNSKYSRSKNPTVKSKTDVYHGQEHDRPISSPDITTGRRRRRRHKKIKRKTDSSTTTITPNVTLPQLDYSNMVRHSSSLDNCQEDEDFPALLSAYAYKPTANPSSMTLSPHVLALNPISTNFAQVVARNKVKK